METLQTVLLVIQVLVAIALIGIILIQHGKGADAGAAFGSGASSTVFGSRGSGNFLTKTTTVLAVLFLANSLYLGYLAANATPEPGSLLDQQAAALQEEAAKAGQEEGAIPDQTIPDQAPAGQAQPSDVPVLPEE